MPHIAALCYTDWWEISVATKHRVIISIDDREFRQLAALSDKHCVSLAWLGRQAIIEFLERHEDEELQLPLTLSSKGRRTGQ
ncbi:MAG: hypothetical protein WD356_00525 [Pseudomonadales bacterium]